MSELQDINFDQLRRQFFEDTSGADGARLILDGDDAFLEKLLQSHWIVEPGVRAVKLRDSVDCLLDYFSIVELAARSGCMPYPLPGSFQTWARRLLSRKAVRRYYAQLYPIALPQLLLQRLSHTGQGSVGDSYPEFVRFLNVSSLRRGEAVETFLWMVDDGITDDGFGLGDVLQVFVKPDKVLAATVRPRVHDGRDLGLQGLLRFMAFCRAFDEFLVVCAKKPALQSAFWHYHGYWFRQMGPMLVGVIGGVIEAFRERVGTAKNNAERKLIRETHTSMDQAHRSMQRLVSGVYSADVDRRLLGMSLDGAETRDLAVSSEQLRAFARAEETLRARVLALVRANYAAEISGAAAAAEPFEAQVSEVEMDWVETDPTKVTRSDEDA